MQSVEGDSEGPTLETFWPFKTNFLQFYNRFAYFMSVTTCKIDLLCKKIQSSRRPGGSVIGVPFVP